MTAAARISPQEGTPTYDLTVRRMDFEFSDEVPEYWYGNDPFRTLLLAALSAGFPPGECFFIDSVRQFRDQITDPELKKAIGAFIGQEAHHSKEHAGLNELMVRRGHAVNKIENEVARLMDKLRLKLSPAEQLAHTAAIEHFTALMSEQFLLHADELESMDPQMAKLWAWHAVEETEHKAVAFDVFKAVSGDEWIRIKQMLIGSVLFTLFSTRDFLSLLYASGHFWDARMWIRGMDHFWGRKGIFRRMIPSYLKYYRRDFHPSQHDSGAQLAKIKARYLNQTA